MLRVLSKSGSLNLDPQFTFPPKFSSIRKFKPKVDQRTSLPAPLPLPSAPVYPLGLMDAHFTDPAALRLLSRTVVLCAKLSDHLQLSHPPQSLTIRTLTSTHSASFQIRLHPSLFTSTQHSSSPLSTKLSTKALVPIFRLPQNLLSLHISHPPTPDIVTFTVTTRSYLTKTYRVSVIDGRIPVAAFDKRNCTGLFSARTSLLQELLNHLHARLDELTITPCPDALRLASFVDDAANMANIMLRTEMTVAAAEFETYNVGNAVNSPLTVFCKYFRAALDFCEVAEEPVKLWFERAGRPLMLELAGRGNSGEMLFDATFVFASRFIEGNDGTDPDLAKGTQHRGDAFPTAGTEVRDLPSQRPAFTATEVEVGETPAKSDYGSSQMVPSSAMPLPSAEHSAGSDHDNYDDGHDDADFVEGTPPP